MPAREYRDPTITDELLDELLPLLFPDIPGEVWEEKLEEDDQEDDWEDDEGGMLFRAVPEIRKIYFNDRHTTIEWMDGEKTTVGCVEGQPFDEYSGFGAAVLKRLFGSSTAAIRCMNECKEVQPAPGKKVKPPTGKTGVKHRA